MKKILYISLFTLLGLILQFMIHAGLEIGYIKLLYYNFNKFSLGLAWNQWFLIHHVFTVVLLIAGLVFGFWQGKYWWQKIYVEQPEWFRKRRFKI